MTWLAIIFVVLAVALFLLGLLEVLTGKNLMKDGKGIYTASSLRHYAQLIGRDIIIYALGLAQIASDIFKTEGLELFSMGYLMVILGFLLTLYSRRVLIKK